jgi:CubicO group peptidase (beta-lactamase class C family)
MRLPISNPRCHVPSNLESITCIGEEEEPTTPRIGRDQIEQLWELTEEIYRTGIHPAIQICVRHNGRRVLHRSIGHAAGNAPDDAPDATKVPLTLDTPVNLFSAAKAISAMVVHKLDEQNVLRLDDPVCEYIPGFERGAKRRITLRHVLSHRAGIPNLPPDAVDLDLLSRPERVVEILCDTKVATRPGRFLAYHAVTGGFILAEVVRRATGKDMREVLEEKIARPLGLRWLSYGVPADKVDDVAVNAFTGYPVVPPLKQVLQRAIGVSMKEAVDLSNDPRFLTGIIPSANICSTSDEVSIFYQCMLQRGAYDGRRIFEPRTVRHATAEQSFWEVDFTLGFPIRYGLGFMLGNWRAGPLGSDNPRAFGHVGLSNVFTWADPERAISVALLTTGKAVLSPHVVPLFALINGIGATFDREFAKPTADLEQAALG